MAGMQVNEDLLDEMLEKYFNQNLNIAGPSIREIIVNAVNEMPNAEEYDIDKSEKIYNNILLDEELIVFYPPSRVGRREAFYGITSKGRMVYNFGGIKKFRAEEIANKKEEKNLKDRELAATERSARSSRSSAMAAWIAGGFAALSFAYLLYQDFTLDNPKSAISKESFKSPLSEDKKSVVKKNLDTIQQKFPEKIKL